LGRRFNEMVLALKTRNDYISYLVGEANASLEAGEYQKASELTCKLKEFLQVIGEEKTEFNGNKSGSSNKNIAIEELISD